MSDKNQDLEECGKNHSMLAVREPLPEEVKQRLEVIQRLKDYKGKAGYRLEKIKASEELGIGISTLCRLIQRYESQGLEGLVRKKREDRGESRKSSKWEEFVMKSYIEGNRGTKKTSVVQIANLVESRAEELGDKSYPGR